MKTNKPVESKQAIVLRLKNRHDRIIENNQKYKQVYVNLPVNELERKFFELYSKSCGLDQTKMLKKFIHALMKRNPKILEKARKELK